MNQGEIRELGPSGCFDKRWAVQGRGKSPYTVSIKYEGMAAEQFGCSCPDWSKHMPRQDCKHIMKIKLETLAPVAAMPATAVCVATPTGRKFRS